MNKQVMIDKIYEVITDKTLSFGCIIDGGCLGRLKIVGIPKYQEGDKKYDTIVRGGGDNTGRMSNYYLDRAKKIGYINQD